MDLFAPSLSQSDEEEALAGLLPLSQSDDAAGVVLFQEGGAASPEAADVLCDGAPLQTAAPLVLVQEEGVGSPEAADALCLPPESPDESLLTLPGLEDEGRPQVAKQRVPVWEDEAVALARAWDGRQLRVGDTVMHGGGLHRKTWTAQGALRLAFQAVGATDTHANRGTSHRLQSMAATVQAEQVSELLGSLSRRCVPWLVCPRSWDSSPNKMEFGRLSEVLAPVARYAYKPDEDTRRALLTHSQLCKLGLKRKAGILEVCAQEAQFLWQELANYSSPGLPPGTMCLRREKLLVLPQILQDTTAGTYYAAVDQAVPGACLEDLFLAAQSSGAKIAILFQGDLAPSNTRCMLAFANKACAFNALAEGRGSAERVLVVQGVCASHIITRGIVQIFKYEQLIPRLFKLGFCLRFPPRYNAVVKCLARLVEEDLGRGGFFRQAEAPPCCRAHATLMLSLTLLRPFAP